jgi:uncharacterized membrane protein YraQ (UPF0718 family)
MLEELQSLSETNKRRILVIATTIIMIIVIGVWFSYFTNTIGQVAQQAAPAVSSTTPSVAAPVVVVTMATTQASGPSLWQNIKNWFGSIANIFQKPSQYNIQPQ